VRHGNMPSMVFAVRGASGVESDQDSALCNAVQELLAELCRKNAIAEKDIVSIVFSQTHDLTSANPATCLRKVGYPHVPLFCTQEPEYPDSKPRMLRVLVTYRAGEEHRPVPVYRGRAASLRPDLG